MAVSEMVVDSKLALLTADIVNFICTLPSAYTSIFVLVTVCTVDVVSGYLILYDVMLAQFGLFGACKYRHKANC